MGLVFSLGSLSSDVFEPWASTGSGLFALLSRDFEQTFGQIVSKRVKTLSKTNLVTLRHTKREKCSLPVDVRQSKTSLLKRPIDRDGAWPISSHLTARIPKVWLPLINSHYFMQTLTNQKSRTVSSWLLIGWNLYERMWINKKRSHFWAPCCNQTSLVNNGYLLQCIVLQWNVINYAVYICTYLEKRWLVFFIVSVATNIMNFQIVRKLSVRKNLQIYFLTTLRSERLYLPTREVYWNPKFKLLLGN